MVAHLCIGIDGGGSGSRAVLRRPDGSRVEARDGPANAFTDPDGTVDTLTRLVASLGAAAGIGADRVASARIVAGVAGCRLPGIAADLAGRLPFPARVVEDSVTTARGALGSRDGTLVSLGTGSFFARRHRGRIVRVGGWGFALGDQASGAWIGRLAVEAALRAADGLDRHDALTRAVMAETAPHPLHHFRAAAPADFAALAPLVIAHAGTATGRRLIAAATSEIAAALDALGHGRDEALVITGGFGAALIPHLRADWQAALAPAAGTPLDGALALAEEMP